MENHMGLKWYNLMNFHKLDTTVEPVPAEKKNTSRKPAVSLAPLPHSPDLDPVDYFCLFEFI